MLSLAYLDGRPSGEEHWVLLANYHADSDSTQTSHLNLRNRCYPSVFRKWAPGLKGWRMLSGKCWNHLKWRYADPDAVAYLHRWCPDSLHFFLYVHSNTHTKTIHKIQLLCHRICCNFFFLSPAREVNERTSGEWANIFCAAGAYWFERCKMLPEDAWRTRHLSIHQRFQTRKVQTQRNA